MVLTPSQVLAVKAPPGTSLAARFDLAWMQALARLNRLDGFLPAIAVWWGAWTLIFPGWTVYWPGNSPSWHAALPVISWVLLCAGLTRIVATRYGWRVVYRFTSVCKLSAWSTLTFGLASLHPIASAGVAGYSALALSELVVWASLSAGIARLQDAGDG